MACENKTLGALLSDPRIAPIAAEAIRARISGRSRFGA